MSTVFDRITRPTLVIDERRVRRNIQFMMEKAQAAGVEFRPHFKTHQSVEVGRWFAEMGVTKITVSSVAMASYFVQAGWKDITIAFPVNVRELPVIASLQATAKIRLVVESADVLRAVIAAAPPRRRVHIFIKADIGYHRTGISPEKTDLIDELLQIIEEGGHKVVFDGFLGHAGHSYHASGTNEIRLLHEESLALMKQLDDKYRPRYPDMCISVGDTPCCSRVTNFAPANEIRPGNFVYYDLEQIANGSCSESKVAVAVFCPIIAVHEDRHEVIVYGGGVHFAKEMLHQPKWPNCFGMAVDYDETGLKMLERDIIIKSLSQEHGVVSVPPKKFQNFKVGDLIAFVPVHSCMTADCLKTGLTFEGKVCDHFAFTSF